MTYVLIKQYDKQHTHIKFEGTFQDQSVIWDTHFFTLDGYNSQENVTNKTLKQFIHIEPSETSETNIFNMTVVLKISEITEPNIQKMIIMVKQYKNLMLGHHEYG